MPHELLGTWTIRWSELISQGNILFSIQTILNNFELSCFFLGAIPLLAEFGQLYVFMKVSAQ